MSVLTQAEFKIVCGVRYNRFYVIRLYMYTFKTLEISVGCCTYITITFLLKLFYGFIILESLTVQNPASFKEDPFTRSALVKRYFL